MEALIDVTVDATAQFWMHRKNGQNEWVKYTLPNGQKLQVPSGEVRGPFGTRDLQRFVSELVRNEQKKGQLVA